MTEDQGQGRAAGDVTSLAAVRATQKAREAALLKREEDDMRALLAAQPYQNTDGSIWWAVARPAEADEVEGDPVATAVLTSAVALGLKVRVERNLIRDVEGRAIPADGQAIAALYRAGECKIVGPIEHSKSLPAIGIRLRVVLEEDDGRGRVVAGQGERQ